MAIVKSSSKKCPVCIICTKSKIKEVDNSLQEILEEVKVSGEVPKARDRRFGEIAETMGIAPRSLRYHLKECLLDQEIQDQRLVELKSLTEAVSTAKTEYMSGPSVDKATAYSSLLSSWRQLASDIEGQTDPEVTVEYVVEAVLTPINRAVLVAAASTLQDLRNGLIEVLPKGQQSLVKSQINSAMLGISNELKASTEEAIDSLCTYYKVELEAKQKKRSIEASIDITPIMHTEDNDIN